jgi:CheY-like chemotaxis protein
MELRVLVVEDAEEHRYIAEQLLRQVGFTVVCVRSLSQGIDQAMILLDPAQPPRPTVILLDLMLPHERCPILEGTSGAAWLIEQMELGYLHPAHIVALSSEMTEERRNAVQLAGCQLVLKKPLVIDQIHHIRELAVQPPILPQAMDARLPAEAAENQRNARRMLRHSAAELIHFIRSEPAYSGKQATPETRVLWQAGDVRVLLTHPTHLLRAEPWRSWVQQHGGVQRLRQRIRIHIQRKWPAKEKGRQALEAYLEHGDAGYQQADQLGMSRATFYRQLDAALEELAADLSSWG